MKVTVEETTRLNTTLGQMRTDRVPWWNLWRELADYLLPKRYVWLMNDKWRRVQSARNPNILDSTGTAAARILASGMMNGITSPARVWFKIRVPNLDDDGGPITQWCDEVAKRMLLVMAESNFYNAIAVLYLDLVVFGTSSMLIYEDDDTVIRCFNPALGEYYLSQDSRMAVGLFAREFAQNARQLVERFGKANCSTQVQSMYDNAASRNSAEFTVYHLIEPNTDGKVPKAFKFVETYWEAGGTAGEVLARRGFHELPGAFPRWELTGNDAYGTCPAMDALGDIIQLQHMTKRKAQGLDKTVSPPIVADIQLQHRPTALLPNGITYVAGANSVGAKPLYQITVPFQELSDDIGKIQNRIQETFYNSLFNMISQLDTVRSATEIDARKEEKLVLLGSVLERFQNEALDASVDRVFSIMNRAGLIPPAPPAIHGAQLQVQYDSILSVAQRATAAAPVERWLQLLGGIAGANPKILNVPNWDELVRGYGLDIGVPAKYIQSREQVAALGQEQDQAQEEAQQADNAQKVALGAQTLSKTEVGGGGNALQAVIGG